MNQMASSVSAVVSKDDSVQRSNLRVALQNRLVDSAVRLPSRYTIFTVQGAALNSPLDYKHMSLTGEKAADQRATETKTDPDILPAGV